MTIAEVKTIVREELAKVSDEALRQAIESYLVPINEQRRKWEWGEESRESYPVWVFADLQVRNLGLAYADGGFKKHGCPWGLVFINDKCSGADYCWYPSLEACVRGSGYFDELKST